jgi:RHS repeat-associated protein
VLHKAGTVTLDGAGYAYDNAGNRTSKTNYLNNVTETYTYDPIYQLTQVTQGATTTESYSYDSVGNRLSSLGMSPYAYNSSNELTSTPSAAFTYDSNGNILTKVDSTGTTAYSWDFENRLAAVVLPGSAGAVAFMYDPFGRRIQKNSPSGVVRYVYDGNDLVEEVDSGGNQVAHYDTGVEVDEFLAQVRSGAAAYYQHDGINSVTSISTNTGASANTYVFDTFGNLQAASGSVSNHSQYTGRDFDQETGLYYYRARYYDPQEGRFLSDDPITFDGGINFYAYAQNNPVTFIDPSGLKLTPAQCEELLKKILRKVEKLEIKINKYDPIEDGKGGHPYSAGRLKGTTQPGEHYFTILRYQIGIWMDVALYQRDCKDGPKCPQKVYEIASKEVPKPVTPTSPFWDWVDDQEWQFKQAWRDFMNPHNAPWWYWFNPYPGKPKSAW